MIQVKMMLSNRHIHLTEEDKDLLFGKGYEVRVKSYLSGPEFASEELVKIVGPKGEIDNVRLLGPLRKFTQVEVLKSDCFKLGIDAPVKLSGNLEGAGSLKIVGPAGEIERDCAIVAKRHLHMGPKRAEETGIENGEIVSIKVDGDRPTIFEDVIVRIAGHEDTVLHVDLDEGNACNAKNGDMVEVIRK